MRLISARTIIAVVVLLKYSGAILRLIGDASSESMEVALQHQQKFWRLAGVIALLFVVIFVLGIIAGIMGSMLWSFIRQVPPTPYTPSVISYAAIIYITANSDPLLHGC